MAEITKIARISEKAKNSTFSEMAKIVETTEKIANLAKRATFTELAEIAKWPKIPIRQLWPRCPRSQK